MSDEIEYEGNSECTKPLFKRWKSESNLLVDFRKLSTSCDEIDFESTSKMYTNFIEEDCPDYSASRRSLNNMFPLRSYITDMFGQVPKSNKSTQTVPICLVRLPPEISSCSLSGVVRKTNGVSSSKRKSRKFYKKWWMFNMVSMNYF